MFRTYPGKEAWDTVWLPTLPSQQVLERAIERANDNEDIFPKGLGTDIDLLVVYDRDKENLGGRKMTCQEARSASHSVVRKRARPGMGGLRISAIACDYVDQEVR